MSRRSTPSQDRETVCFEAFLHGFVDLCASSPGGQELPITLHYDQGRIQQLRGDVQDLVFLKLCINIFNELLSTPRGRIPVPPLTYLTLESRLLTVIDEEASQPAFLQWTSKSAEIATEISRAAFVVASFPHPPRMPAEAFNHTQARLAGVFDECYDGAEARLLAQLAEETVAHASDFQKMTTKDISVAQRLYQQQRLGRGDLDLILALPDLENMSRMVAHIGVIHWQVWRSLAYVRDGLGGGVDAEAEAEAEMETDGEFETEAEGEGEAY